MYGENQIDRFLGGSVLGGGGVGVGMAGAAGVFGAAGMANQAQDAPTPMPPVVARLEEMDKSVEVLKDELLTLVTRLQPFMRSTPKAAGGETKSRECECEMEAKLARTCTALHELIYVARSAREALCI